MTIKTELVSQTPVRNLAALWIDSGKLIAARPIVAQSLVKRTYEDGSVENEFDFVVYSSENGSELAGCCYSFPNDIYGTAWVIPCSDQQWQRLFSSPDAVLAVAKQLCDIDGGRLEGWKT